MKILKINDNLEYQFNFDDNFKDHKFISFKKIKRYKKNTNYQTLTINHDDWGNFYNWIKEILDEHPPF